LAKIIVYWHPASPIATVFFCGTGDFDFTATVHCTHTKSTCHPPATRTVTLDNHHGIKLRREPNLTAVAASLMFYHDSSLFKD
jgi:hypothetical protein